MRITIEKLNFILYHHNITYTMVTLLFMHQKGVNLEICIIVYHFALRRLHTFGYW